MIGQSIRRRILKSVLLLTLATGGVFAIIAYVSYEMAVDRLVRWHMEPVMRLLVAADEGKLTGNKGTVVGSEELAKTLKLKLRTGKSIRRSQRPDKTDEADLIRLDRDRYLLTYRTKSGQDYAIEGKIQDFDDLEEAIVRVFAVCLAASLLLAGLIGLILGQTIVSPLLALAREVREGAPLEASRLCRRRDEIGFLAKAFADRETSLKHYLAREQLFTGDVSHELRTPLTVIQGSLEVLESRADGELPPDLLHSQIERMQRTVADMTAMVNTMLLLARKPEQVRNALIDLSGAAREAAQTATDKTDRTNRADSAERVHSPACGKTTRFSAEIAPAVQTRGHAELAALILNNLLDNACRYAMGGNVRLYLTPDCVVVEDSAPPIAEEVRSRMFERGTRGKSAVPGSGLGLSLVQRACEHMGWTVDYEAPPQGGNRFVVRFPAA